jgi:hypothetical protein
MIAAAAPSLVCDELPAVTVAADVERGLQLCQRFERGVSARTLVRIERQFLHRGTCGPPLGGLTT